MADNDQTQDQDRKDDGKQRSGPLMRWLFIGAGAVIVVFVAVVLAIIFVPTRHVWTDDAYVTAHYTVVAPRISGQVIAVDVTDNQSVKAGQVLVELDPRDEQTALDQARATLDRDQSLVQDAASAVTRQPSIIDESVGEAARIGAQLVFARQNARRYTNLARTGAGSTQENQQSAATLREMEATLQSLEARIAAARAQLPILQARHKAAEATVELDRARLRQTELDLSYTKVRALEDGMIGERTVQTGNYVSPGAALMALVPLDQIWIRANYRELALHHMRPGQPVKIHVDAYDATLDGIVDSIPPASGAVFSPIAPENATGNFTKIVQRLPVKIVLVPNQPVAKLLRLGFSVETTVDTGLADIVADQQHETAGTVTGHESARP
ncbi:HlyD family secretion protein [Gluconacetobacter takamatsuzukensis]|uniref:HlyD family secretion protein n=1 Tax=Gluconacetobacter takamatsuzukensis TaxID=1286190 RepID=A0A7W4KFS0_9PROT|nr:HlyD family secretion protein [Gluconacetobacter takamatsuzukensis]MBB2206113.1 HlyD family secretion protein [Gluconacetobacter takamatsuzukensis]